MFSLYHNQNRYVLSQLFSATDLSDACRLRHEVFCDELWWREPNADGLETDAYDTFAEHLGVYTVWQELIATVRIVNAIYPMVIEKDFSGRVGAKYMIRKEQDTAEISRLALKKEYRSSSANLLPLIHSFIYHHLRNRGIRYTYAVVDKRHYAQLNQTGFDCWRIGRIQECGRGKALACLVDWVDFPKNYHQFIDIDAVVYRETAQAMSPLTVRRTAQHPQTAVAATGNVAR